MKCYTEYEVLDYNEVTGQARVAWYERGRRDHALIEYHDVPLEAELENWSREQLVNFWRKDVRDIPDTPPWLVPYA